MARGFSPAGQVVKAFFGGTYPPFNFVDAAALGLQGFLGNPALGGLQGFGNPDGGGSGGGAWAAGGPSPYGPNQGGAVNPPIANAIYAVSGGQSHLDTSGVGGSISNPQLTIAGGGGRVANWAVTQFPALPGAPVQTLLFFTIASDGQVIAQPDLVSLKFNWPYTGGGLVSLTGAGATAFSFATPNAQWQYDLTGLFAMTDTANHSIPLGIVTA